MKHVLFDENMPRKLRRELPEMTIRTVQEEDWSGYENGELLRRASDNFDVFVTVDQNVRFQQNVAQFNIGVVVIEAVDTTIANLRRFLPQIREAIERATPGAIVRVNGM